MFKPIIWLIASASWKNRKDIDNYIKTYIDSWAEEFFTGYTPSYWSDKFWFEVSPNWRFSEHEQITKKEDLEMVINTVHKYEKEIFWNLNAWYYTGITEKEIKQIIWEYIELGIDGFICWNIWIIEYLESISEKQFDKGYIINWKKIKINISTIMAVYNKSAISFLLKNYPINKVILSREVTLKEIEEITSAFPNLDFEVFWEWDFCRYNNGLCFAEHKYGSRDICTVVVNDLIYKKGIHYDFRKKILEGKADENTFDNDYKNEFQTLKNLFKVKNIDFEKVRYLLDIIYKKYTLYYDVLEWLDSINNKNVKLLIDTLSYLKMVWKTTIEDEEYLRYLKEEKKESLKYNISKFKKISKEKDLFYNKSDLFNLYSYLFFDTIPNITTVKFPTRGRNYIEKLNTIKETLKTKHPKINIESSPKRTHYDLKHLFDNDKKWFEKIRMKNHK